MLDASWCGGGDGTRHAGSASSLRWSLRANSAQQQASAPAAAAAAAAADDDDVITQQ